MKSTLKIFLGLSVLFITHNGNSQGCVAIRGNGACGSVGSNINLEKGEFNPQIGLRYFESYKHFRGTHEETERVELGTQVINDSYFLDVALAYGITDRWYASTIIPFVHHKRSSMYEHGGNPPNGLGERHTTSSQGLGDVRLNFGYWLFDPMKKKFNYSVAIGVKLPTGNYSYTDTFYNQGPNKDEDLDAVVDQSIQPGDGGLGITLEFIGYHPFGEHFALSSNLYYLSNFYETNGVLTRRGNSEFSCPDQYALRIGGFYNTNVGISGYLGGRWEGVPSSDLIGGDAGYRRPGYAISIEPGVSYSKNKFYAVFSVPVAVSRNRVQSYEDIQSTQETGVFKQGDAAFADFLLNLTLSYRFGGKKSNISVEHSEDM